VLGKSKKRPRSNIWCWKSLAGNDEGFGRELDLPGVLLEFEYERFGEENNLQVAIEKAEEAVRVTPIAILT
jgi:hypothetical protein